MRIACLPLLLSVVLFGASNAQAEPRKTIVGATEVIFIEDANLSFTARVDTGAKTSSIHAEDIEVDLSAGPVGQPISFTVVTRDGQSQKIETRLISIVTVRTSEKSEERYVVPLQMNWKGTRKTVLVTLNDRKAMTYRLLLGRNWLRGEYIVDVDINSAD